MFQKANIKIFVWLWAYVYSPFERCYFFSQATMMHLAGHFESCFSLVAMCVAALIVTNLKAEREN